jgi:hypothetical protein
VAIAGNFGWVTDEPVCFGVHSKYLGFWMNGENTMERYTQTLEVKQATRLEMSRVYRGTITLDFQFKKPTLRYSGHW